MYRSPHIIPSKSTVCHSIEKGVWATCEKIKKIKTENRSLRFILEDMVN